MPSSIRVANPPNTLFWEKQLSNEEVEKVRKHCQNSAPIGILSATLKPVRTDTLENFSKDFFFPTFVNHAIKVQHAVGKIFAILGALILDLVTFPIRLLTCIPRVMTNSKKEEHPLYRYLQDQAVNPKIFASDYVLVNLKWEGKNPLRVEWRYNDGTVHRSPDRAQMWEERCVHFIDLPMYPGGKNSSHGSSAALVLSNNTGEKEWRKEKRDPDYGRAHTFF